MNRQYLVVKAVFSAVSFSLLLSFSKMAQAATFNEIVVFGDSFSDTGNVFAATDGNVPLSPPYFQGRFSNGLVWVENLSSDFGSPLTSFAVGGANTNNLNNLNVLNPTFPFALSGLQQQIQLFTGEVSSSGANQNGLYIVQAGVNDFLISFAQGNYDPDPSLTVNNILDSVTSLIDVGVKNIMVSNIPDLGQFPATRDTQFSSPLSAITQTYNDLLSQELNRLNNSNSNVNIVPLDFSSLVENINDDPVAFGLQNVTDACFPYFPDTIQFPYSICSQPNEYLFWDEIHPTANFHEILANSAATTLDAANLYSVHSVPESSSVIGTLAFSAIGGLLSRRRFNK
jgi:phospholipase/lecithinase/hemolysin